MIVPVILAGLIICRLANDSVMVGLLTMLATTGASTLLGYIIAKWTLAIFRV